MEDVMPVMQSVLVSKVAVELTTVVPVNAELAQTRWLATAANKSKFSSSESDLVLQLVSESTNSTIEIEAARICFLSIRDST